MDSTITNMLVILLKIFNTYIYMKKMDIRLLEFRILSNLQKNGKDAFWSRYT